MKTEKVLVTANIEGKNILSQLNHVQTGASRNVTHPLFRDRIDQTARNNSDWLSLNDQLFLHFGQVLWQSYSEDSNSKFLK